MDSDFDPELLITLVQERPTVWDKTLEEYKSRTHTIAAWREICEKLNPEFKNIPDKAKNAYGKLIIKKWKNIKDQYMKKIKGKSGDAATKRGKKYIFHDQLTFLKEGLDMRETQSSFDVDSNSLEELDDEMKDNEDIPDKGDTLFETATQDKPYSSIKVSGTKRPGSTLTSAKKKIDIEREILDALSTKEERFLSFFKGLLPSLKDLADDEALQFQSAVINAIQDIKRDRTHQVPVLSVQPSCSYSNLPRQGEVPYSTYDHNPPPRWNEQFSSGSQTPLPRSVFGIQLQSPSPLSPVPSDLSECSSIGDINFASTVLNL